MTPLSFYLKGLAALFLFFLLTLAMEPAPIVDALRAFIGVGAAIVVLKLVLRHFGIDFPGRRR
jgi:hypothetical protein